MAQSAIDKIPPGPKLDALTAGKVFGWRKVHRLWSHFSDPHRIHELRREEKKRKKTILSTGEVFASWPAF